MSIINLNDVEIYLNSNISDGNPSTTSGLEAQWNFIISAVNKKIENICNRIFSVTAHTERRDGNGKSFLLLKNYPVTSVTSVNYIDIDSNLTEFELTDIVVNNDIGELYSPYGFTKGNYNIQCTYEAGYSDEDMPDDLKQTACRIAVDTFNSSSINTNKSSENFGDYSYTLSSAIEISDMYSLMLSQYIRYDW